MKKSVLFLILAAAARTIPASTPLPVRPAHTYSIVALDKATGELGAAVQSHWFSVGALVPWVEAGVGAVCTQSFVEASYGPLGLELMRAGRTAEEALAGLLRADKNEAVRQVGMVDAAGRVAAHTGKSCIAAAGHYLGAGFACQANMMLKETVWKAMAKAFESARGELVDRLLAALEAAEGEGGDIRGRQSAAVVVVRGKTTGMPWKDRVYDLRVEDHAQPLAELRRLIKLNKAYNHMNAGDDLLTAGRTEEAMKAYTRGMEIYPDNPEMIFWPAVTLASTGKVEDSLPLFRKVFAVDRNWAELLRRLPAAGQFPKDRRLLDRILALVPQK
ncbi:MAG: DUF1028 domain-containing protein [Candidatus Aminicenantes bacterium]|nr:DUF1028 domain-containing protein [Candidatus Aminicenantes bacterium]